MMLHPSRTKLGVRREGFEPSNHVDRILSPAPLTKLSHLRGEGEGLLGFVDHPSPLWGGLQFASRLAHLPQTF